MPLVLVHVRKPSGPPTPKSACSIKPGDTKKVNVRRLRLAFHAVFGGGAVSAGGSPLTRTMYRLHLLSSARAVLEPSGGWWSGTSVHREAHDDKSALSHRAGVTMAAAVSDLVLNLRAFVHREALVAPTKAKRGDFFAVRRGTYQWHGVEAKGRGPHRSTGAWMNPSKKDYADAKKQAQSLGDDLAAAGIPGSNADHWTIHTRTATSAPVLVDLEDPIGEGGDEPPTRSTETAERSGDEGIERLLRSYYQVAGDIAELSSAQYGEPSSGLLADVIPGAEDYVAFRPPGSTIWLGAHRAVLEALQAGTLAEALPRLVEIPEVERSFGMTQMGLALAFQEASF